MKRRIKLKKYNVTQANFQFIGAYRLRIEAHEAAGLDNRIFLYRRNPADPYTGAVVDDFFAICSPVDLAEYPPEAPDPNRAFPFFRTNYVELDLRSTHLADRLWVTVVHEVNELLEGLDKLDELQITEEVWCGDPPFPVGAGSDSSASFPGE